MNAKMTLTASKSKFDGRGCTTLGVVGCERVGGNADVSVHQTSSKILSTSSLVMQLQRSSPSTHILFSCRTALACSKNSRFCRRRRAGAKLSSFQQQSAEMDRDKVSGNEESGLLQRSPSRPPLKDYEQLITFMNVTGEKLVPPSPPFPTTTTTYDAYL